MACPSARTDATVGDPSPSHGRHRRPPWQVASGVRLYDLLATGAGFQSGRWQSSADFEANSQPLPHRPPARQPGPARGKHRMGLRAAGAGRGPHTLSTTLSTQYSARHYGNPPAGPGPDRPGGIRDRLPAGNLQPLPHRPPQCSGHRRCLRQHAADLRVEGRPLGSQPRFGHRAPAAPCDIFGGKWTTSRSLAVAVADIALH